MEILVKAQGLSTLVGEKRAVRIITMFATYKMEEIKVPEFDSIQGHREPSDMFGEMLSGKSYHEALEGIIQLHSEIIIRVQNSFGNFDSADCITTHLDRLVKEMWNTGWNPDCGNLNLFTTDLGLLLTMELLKENGTKLIIRSKEILDHLSVWHEASQSEYFPFHKMKNMLSLSTGESARQMLKDLKQKTNSEPVN